MVMLFRNSDAPPDGGRIQRAILVASTATEVRNLAARAHGEAIEIHGVAPTSSARFLAFRMISETLGENVDLVNRIEVAVS